MSTEIDRYLLALPRGDQNVYLSWRLVESDAPGIGYDVERRPSGGEWECVSAAPITDSTNFMDAAPDAGNYDYRVREAAGGAASESVRVDAGAPASIKVVDAPLVSKGKNTWHLAGGELLNDGRMGFVTTVREEGQLHLDAYAPDGAHLWRRPLGFPTNLWLGHSCGPYLVWDVNHDGRTEVLCRRAATGWEGEIKEARESGSDDSFWRDAKHLDPRPGDTLTAFDGETGEIVWEVPWPGQTFDMHMTLGYVQGRDKPPALVITDGSCYPGRGGTRLYAMDGSDGTMLWEYFQERGTGHNLDVGDVDEDGVQEVIAGGTCLNGDGTVRWQAEPFGHTDISKPCKINPDLPGLQVYFAVETRDTAGVYLVDQDGKTLFKEKFRHAHYGWIARHTDKVPGLQPHTAEDARSEFGAQDAGMREEEHNPIFLPDGAHWGNLTEWQRKNFVPVQWDEGARTVFIARKENRLVRLLDSGADEPLAHDPLPPGGRYGRNLLCADIAGDYRENIATIDEDNDRLMVLANPEVATSRGRSPFTDFHYRHDRSQHGSGYYIYVAPPVTTV